MSLALLNSKLAGLGEKRKNGQSENRARERKKTETPSIVQEGPQSTMGALRRKLDPRGAIPAPVLSLLACITNDDIKKVAQVWREGMDATQKIWVDTSVEVDGKRAGHWEFPPDFKTRNQSAQFIAAYREGLPVARQIQIRAEFESMDDTLERLKNSPEAMAAIAGLRAAGLELAIEGEVIDVESSVERESE